MLSDLRIKLAEMAMAHERSCQAAENLQLAIDAHEQLARVAITEGRDDAARELLARRLMMQKQLTNSVDSRRKGLAGLDESSFVTMRLAVSRPDVMGDSLGVTTHQARRRLQHECMLVRAEFERLDAHGGVSRLIAQRSLRKHGSTQG